MKNSKIEWTNDTWNPWYGCRKVSPGCKNCYMYRDMARFGKNPQIVQRASEATFQQPYKLKGPFVFTCSWSDFFISDADKWRAEAWEIIKKTPHLTYQILTKRPECIKTSLPKDWGDGYPNVWLGVTIENQDQMWKIHSMRATPARIRFISAEPLLGPIKFNLEGFDWVITGGESGPECRKMDAEWALDIALQCKAAGVAYFHKQNGGTTKIDGAWGGRELFGQIHNSFPEVKLCK